MSFAGVIVIAKYTLQILILIFGLFKAYGIVVHARAIPALRSTIMMSIIIMLAYLLRLDMITWIVEKISPFLLISLAVAFQPEIRKMFTVAGNSFGFSNQSKASKDIIDSILTVAEALAKLKRGALITLGKKISLKTFIDSGVPLDAVVSASLLNTIFSHDTPLHDGAVIIQNNRIVAAGCFLPITKQEGIEKTFGSRHRAALGMAEETDAVTVVVSEETGTISVTHDGILYYNQGVEGARQLLRKLLDVSVNTTAITENLN